MQRKQALKYVPGITKISLVSILITLLSFKKCYICHVIRSLQHLSWVRQLLLSHFIEGKKTVHFCFTLVALGSFSLASHPDT